MDCPTWTYRNVTSNDCICGVDLQNSVKCNSSTKQVHVRSCHMITFDPSRKETVAGFSLYGCIHKVEKYTQMYFSVPSNISEITHNVCNQFNRNGTFCGTCKEGYSPLVYSYKLQCKLCSMSENRRNWIAFLAVILIPQTLFYIFVVLYKFNANASSLHGFVLVAQLLTQISSTKTILARVMITDRQSNQFHGMAAAVIILQTLYSVWNLDFFRALYPDICLQVTTLMALSLDYVVAFYPLFLIMLTFLLTELHSRGFKVVLFMWSPFHRFLFYFRKQWDIKSSLVDVFATFLLLSYNRLLDLSFSLLMFTKGFNSKGQLVDNYLFYDSSIAYFGKEHRFYGFFAIFVLVFFNFFPFLLLLFYPMQCFQKCLNHLQLNSIALRMFVDSFAGCYKDGTEPNTRDCRYFAALFFLFRVLNYVVFMCTYSAFYFFIFLTVVAFFCAVLVYVQPYKEIFSHHNTTTIVMLILVIVMCCCLSCLSYVELYMPEALPFMVVVCILVTCLPQVYVSCLVLKWIYNRKPWSKICTLLFIRHVRLEMSDQTSLLDK